MLKKYFDKLLTKDIKSKIGVQHFKRWQLFTCKYFTICLHGIYKEDLDLHCHNHAWNIFTMILKGSYDEQLVVSAPDQYLVNTRTPLDCAYRNRNQYHKILKLNSPVVYTLAIMGRREGEWGYLTENGHVNHEIYRDNKANKS